MTKLSVNINKLATIRNARGGNNPDLLKAVRDIESFGAQGITVHPRPDERHIRYSDIPLLKNVITTEFNIEGNPKERNFMDLVLENRPEQVTLVPDVAGVLTSNQGWNTVKEFSFLTETISEFKRHGIRTSIFLDPDILMLEAAKKSGADRIELYTERYASYYNSNRETAIAPYLRTAEAALALDLEINAGHDLDLQNLNYFYKHITGLKEVSIGHALICDAINLGLKNTIKLYLNRLDPTYELR
ncbi:MAG: pyridoxine 5'-phosphate synthase [Bacteroidia bacterium]|nr:pyridoxine 5'-phosphate synthase [Bacteroidia bacterium]